MELENVHIEAQTLPLNALRVEYAGGAREGKSRSSADWHTRIVLPDGQRMMPSSRFWLTFSSLFGLSQSVFDFFAHEEVFARIAEKKGDSVRVAFEKYNSETADGRMLSVTKPEKPLLRVGQARKLLDEFRGVGATYGDGVVTARFDCPFPLEFEVGGDGFRTQFHLEMPVDGWGLPSAYLSLLRLICSNGLVGITPAFRTQFQLGNHETDLDPVLRRAFETFNNEEGFHSFRQRVEAASKSWASLHEALSLRKILSRTVAGEKKADSESNPMLQRFDSTCGDPLAFYGLSARDELSARKARSIPVATTLYDLFNFASEVATHHLGDHKDRDRVHAWVGQTLTSEYDLEGTKTVFGEYRDFFLARADVPALPAQQALNPESGIEVP